MLNNKTTWHVVIVTGAVFCIFLDETLGEMKCLCKEISTYRKKHQINEINIPIKKILIPTVRVCALFMHQNVDAKPSRHKFD